MKIRITILALLLITFCTVAKAKSGMQDFYAQHKTDQHTESIRLPKILFAFLRKDPETRALLRCLKSIRIFHMEALSNRRGEVIRKLEDALTGDNFESLFQVTDNGERINIYIDQDEQHIRKMLIMIDSGDELVLLQAKTRISFEQLSGLMNDYTSGNDKSGLKKIINIKG